MESSKTGEKTRQNLHCRLLILLTVTVTTGIYWNVQNYLTTQEQAEYQLLKQEWHRLNQDNNILQVEAQLLAEDSQQQMQQIALQQVTDVALRDHLTELQDQVIDLEKELLFYQNITQNNSHELQVKEIELHADDSIPGQVRYRLVLTQGARITQPITGNIILSLKGRSSEAELTIEVGTIPFSLRYVQVLEGQIKLEDGFTPEQVLVDIQQKKKKMLTYSFEWTINPSD